MHRERRQVAYLHLTASELCNHLWMPVPSLCRGLSVTVEGAPEIFIGTDDRKIVFKWVENPDEPVTEI